MKQEAPRQLGTLGIHAGEHVRLNDYIIVHARAKAVAVRKRTEFNGEWTWLPRAMCQDGETLELGDADLSVREGMAEEKGLDWR
ncbi:MAG TPA: hypothetical protein VNW93_05365 [Mycobacterium sp.]|nr:hypothetical protein [Mycobacterium sp.]